MSAPEVTARLFAFIGRAGFAVPRRGAVKVWTTETERQMTECLTPVLAGSGVRAGLAEVRLSLTPGGKVQAAEIETSCGDATVDRALVAALLAGPRYPITPAPLREASFLLLLEYAPQDATAGSWA